MRVKIDAALCSGHGRCLKYAPDVFQIDADGFNAQRGEEFDVPDDLSEALARGIKACPERAIAIVE